MEIYRGAFFGHRRIQIREKDKKEFTQCFQREVNIRKKDIIGLINVFPERTMNNIATS